MKLTISIGQSCKVFVVSDKPGAEYSMYNLGPFPVGCSAGFVYNFGYYCH